MDIEQDGLLSIVGDLEIPCDYADSKTCPDLPAHWILYRKRDMCTCGKTGAVLACDHCKDVRMSTDGALICTGCGDCITPPSSAYSLIEPL